MIGCRKMDYLIVDKRLTFIASTVKYKNVVLSSMNSGLKRKTLTLLLSFYSIQLLL